MATIVDDSVILHNNDTLFQDFKAVIKKHVLITIKNLSHMCGLRVTHNVVNCKLKVDQQEYIETKAKQFGWTEGGCSFSPPMSPAFENSAPQSKPDLAKVTEAREKIGSILFMTLTRADLSFFCSKIASVAPNPADSS
jgi:hypothetical protein